MVSAAPSCTAEVPLSAIENHLIETLPRRDREHLLAACRTVELRLGEVLCLPGDRTHHVWFPLDGFISLMTVVDGEPGLEVGMVGYEGMVGVQHVLGVSASPLRAVVQGAGTARRIGSVEFRRELLRSPALRRQLGRYIHVLMGELAASASCLRFHLIAPRLARWLLMSHDRAHADHFHVTHEFLAYMLGVRRVGITVAAGVLHRRGLIDYHRGEVTVVDRAGLEAAACGCYAIDREAYAAQL
jgi:CRP-like cAMP-binding protein